MRLDTAQIQATVDYIKAHHPDDDTLLTDMLEGETDLFDMVNKLLDAEEREVGVTAALDGQIDDRKARKARSKARKDAARKGISYLMEIAEQSKITLPEATLSLRKIAPKRIVIEPLAVPEEYQITTTTYKPDLKKLKEAEGEIDGTTFDNGGVSLTIRRK